MLKVEIIRFYCTIYQVVHRYLRVRKAIHGVKKQNLMLTLTEEAKTLLGEKASKEKLSKSEFIELIARDAINQKSPTVKALGKF